MRENLSGWSKLALFLTLELLLDSDHVVRTDKHDVCEIYCESIILCINKQKSIWGFAFRGDRDPTSLF